MDKPLSCSKCQFPLEVTLFNTENTVPCPSCKSQIQVIVFPAFFRPKAAAAAGEVIIDEEDASCFFHPQKKAAVSCDSCGRFLCQLCDVELKSQHLCPECLEKGVRKKKLVDLDNRRDLHDSLALTLSILSIPFFMISFIFAPIVLGIIFKHYKAPLALMRTSRWRFWVAGVISVAELLGWIYIILAAWVL